jgi:hypothetical protein
MGHVKSCARCLGFAKFEEFTDFRAFEPFSQSSQNELHKLPGTCRPYNFPFSSGYREMFVSSLNIKNVQSEMLASAVFILGYLLFCIIRDGGNYAKSFAGARCQLSRFHESGITNYFLFEFLRFTQSFLLFSLYLGVSTRQIELRGDRPIES